MEGGRNFGPVVIERVSKVGKGNLEILNGQASISNSGMSHSLSSSLWSPTYRKSQLQPTDQPLTDPPSPPLSTLSKILGGKAFPRPFQAIGGS